MSATSKWAILFSLIILFNSCSVYKNKTSLKLEDVIRDSSNVKVRTVNRRFYRDIYLQRSDGKILGLRPKSDKKIFELEEDQIVQIYERNKKLSNILTIFGITYLVVGTILVIIYVPKFGDNN